jgi:hypothetical protein
MLIKVYGNPDPDGEHKYSPPEVVETITKIQIGDPDLSRICTSIVERSNLSMRTSIRRLTPVNKRIQQEMGEFTSGARAVLRLLQLLPDSFIYPLYSGDGSGDHWTCLGDERIALINNGCIVWCRMAF